MSQKEQTELGSLLVELPISYISVLDITVIENANEHARMELRLMAEAPLSKSDMDRAEDMPVTVSSRQGDILFHGLIRGIGLSNESDYSEVTVNAVGLSVRTDERKKNRTFQSTGKTLQEITDTVMGEYGISVEVTKDVPIEIMLSQKNETDWEFLRRVANKFGALVFTDCHSKQLRITLGTQGFSEKPEEKSVNKTIEKNISAFLKLKGNINPDASAYEFESVSAESHSLNTGSGHISGGKPVTSNRISVSGGLVQNQRNTIPKEGAVPDFAQTEEPVMTSEVVTGTVLAVEGNDIQVRFHVDGDGVASGTRWIPYEHAVNNYLYSMPEAGDTVYVYYEKQGKAVCLGSSRPDTSHPDFQKPENKLLTSCNRTIKFTPKTVELIGDRKEYDMDTMNRIDIVFNDPQSGGITMISGMDVRIAAKEKLIIQAAGEEVSHQETVARFEAAHQNGETKYITDGGLKFWQQEELSKKIKGSSGQPGIKDILMGMVPTELINTISDTVFQRTGVMAPPEEEPGFTEGMIELFGVYEFNALVGESSLMVTDYGINIKTPLYRSLGFNKKEYPIEADEESSWFDVILDVAQFALDIVGFIPIIGDVADLVNAGISLARGDYFGAAMSLVSAIPGVGSFIGGAGKAIQKGGKIISKIGKAVKKIKKFYDMAMDINTVLTSIRQWEEIAGLIKSGEFDITNPSDVRKVISSLGAVKVAAKHGIKKHTSNKQKKAEQEAEQKRRQESDNVNTNKKKTTDANGSDNKDFKCEKDPINVVTGSLMTYNTDFSLKDTIKPFVLKRTYESVYENEGRMLGSKWQFNIESRIVIQGDKTKVLLPDMHVEIFYETETGYENKRKGDRSYLLVKHREGYTLKHISEKTTYEYNSSGSLSIIKDSHNNQTRFIYSGNTLTRIELSGGQYMEFEYRDGKVGRITDTIGRVLSYNYQGDYLTEVTQVDKGTITYSYTKEGYLESTTDQNGNRYVTNTYDSKGRVIRQVLSNGQEYTILYNDSDRVNTFFTESNGERKAYAYDKNKWITKIIYGDDSTEEFAYDEWENEIRYKDRNGAETYRSFNEKCLLLEETLPGGLTTTYIYDKENNLIELSDNAGSRGTFTYDNSGNMLSEEIRIDEKRTRKISYSYDQKGRMIQRTEPTGGIYQFEYHTGFSQPSVITTPEGSRFYYTHDEAGRTMKIEGEKGTVTYAYNSYDQKTIITDAEGNVTKYGYDRLCNMVKKVLPNEYDKSTGDGKGTTYTYDNMDNLIQTKNAGGTIYARKVNKEGSLIKEIHPEKYNPETRDGEGIWHEYDSEERRIRTHYPDSGIMRYFYDASGNLIKQVTPEEYNQKTDDGDGTIYRYDGANRLIEIEDANHVIIKRYVYDLQGNVTKEIDAKGIASADTDEERIGTLYKYNLLTWKTEERTPVRISGDGVKYRLIRYRYDESGNLTEEQRYLDEQNETSVSGRVHIISYTYDKENRRIRVRDSAGAVIEYHYNAHNQLIQEKKKISENLYQTTNYEYSAAGRLSAVSESTDKAGTGRHFATTHFSHDKTGNLTRIVTPLKYEIQREYDITNQLVKETYIEPKGEICRTTAYRYDKAGNISEVTYANGYKMKYEYDLMNKEVKTVGRDGTVTLKAYNKNGIIKQLILPNEAEKQGMTTAGYQYAYDKMNRLLTLTAPDGRIREKNHYNQYGELIEQADGMDSGMEISYDLAGRRESITTKGGSSQQYSYDAFGNITAVTDGNSGTTKFTLDEWGRIIKIKKADGSKEQYNYDYAGNITETINANGSSIRYAYNEAGLLSSYIDAKGGKETYLYDLEGRLKEVTDRNGNTTLYQTNMFGSLKLKRSRETGLSESYEYYPDGKLKAAISEGMRYNYGYYADGRLKSKSASGRTLISYEYDGNGNLTCQTDVTGKRTEYKYNDLDLLTEVYDNGKRKAAYTYDLGGNLISLIQGEDNLSEISQTCYTYDMDKNLTSLSTSLSGEVMVQNSYRYDRNGNLTEKKQISGTTAYTYDSVNQLVKAAYPGYTEELYYDKTGNRTRRVTEAFEEAYEYDICNRLISKTKTGKGTVKETIDGNPEITAYTYDKQGNMLQDGRAAYTYDAFNRMSKAETEDKHTQVNRYDAEGLRHEMEENGELVKFIYSGREVIGEESAKDYKRYILGHEIICSESDKARTYYHYFCDEMGSTTHIVDEDGNVKNRYEYDAFGNTLLCEENIENRFRYAGQQYDPVIEQYYLRARFYNPVIARFIQEDTYHGDGLNLYVYCKNNPVGYFDPSGYLCDKKTVNKFKEMGYTDEAAYAAGKIYAKHRNNGEPATVCMQKARAAARMAMDDGNYYKPGFSEPSSTRPKSTDYYVSSDGKFINNNPGGPYSHLKDGKSVGPGKDFTTAQRAKIYAENRKNNGGVVKSDVTADPYNNLVKAKKSSKGVSPNPAEYQIDHIIPKNKGGTNSYSNAQVTSRKYNRDKSDKY